MLEELRKVNKSNKVCFAKKSGLKRAGWRCSVNLDETLKKIGLIPSVADSCLYIGYIEGEKVIASAYVDDLIIASIETSLPKTKELKANLDLRDRRA